MAKEETEQMKELMNRLHGELVKTMAGLESDKERNDWLRHLHSRYSERFMKDNDRIWTIGNIFIPLSLVGLAGLHQATVYTVLPIAIASIALMFFWLMFAENHRAAQNYSLAIVKAIEIFINLDLKSGKIDGMNITNKFSVRSIRWKMFWFVVIVWISAVALVCIKYYNSPFMKLFFNCVYAD